MKQQWIGLLDCNNFFVSCERLFRPDLVGKPVVVLSSNDGCVVARSQEIKDIGIPMGVPYFKIKDTLKDIDATTFSSHFALYRDISRRVFAVMREELGTVEQYSIDEAFFISGDKPDDTAWRIKQAVERQVGIPVSVGLASTKTQAKYANTVAKKTSGVYVLNTKDWQARMADIQLRDIWGVGGNLEIRYKGHGLHTVQDLLKADTSRVARIFGVGGMRLRQELAGEATISLSSRSEPQKSILSSRSFRATTTDFSVLADAIAYHVRHAVADLRSMQLEATLLRVAISPSRYGDFLLRGGAKEVILSVPSNDTIEFLTIANELLVELFEVGVPYKKAGITLARFSPEGTKQSGLFSEESKDNKDLLKTIDTLNQKADRELILFGSRLRSNDSQSRSESRSPAYTTQWSDVAVANAS